MKTQLKRRKEERRRKEEYIQAREQMIAKIQRELRCTKKEARIVVDLDLSSTEVATKKKCNQEDELTDLAKLIEKHFTYKQFKNADLSKHLGELPYEMTARQIPSRLKRLVEMGVLESTVPDSNWEPIVYKLPYLKIFV